MKKNTLTILAKNFLYYNTPTNRSNELSIFGIGREKCIVNKMEGPKRFSFYSMHVILNGKGTFIIDGVQYTAKANQIIMFPPDSELVYYPDSEDPWEYIWCNFSGTVADDLCNRCNFSHDNPILETVTADIIKAAKSMTKLYNRRYSMDVAILGNFYELFGLIIEHVCSKNSYESSKIAKPVLDVINFLHQNYQDPNLTLEKASQHVHLHFNYLSQLFKKMTGCTFNYYLNLFRIQKACTILTNEKKTIKETSEEVGFIDPLYFSKVFKKYKGLSPKQYLTNEKSK